MKRILFALTLLLLPSGLLAQEEERVVTIPCLQYMNICFDVEKYKADLWEELKKTMFAECDEKKDCSMEDPADPGSGKKGTLSIYDLGDDRHLLVHESVPPGAYGPGITTTVLISKFPTDMMVIPVQFQLSPANEKLKDDGFLQCGTGPIRGGIYDPEKEQFTREEASNSAGECVVRCVWGWNGNAFMINEHSIKGKCGKFSAESRERTEPQVLYRR